MTATRTAPTDSLGVEIKHGDVVMITAWGAPVRLCDTGRRSTAVDFSRAGYVKLADNYAPDTTAGGRAVPGNYLAVIRRDGTPGFEGNR